MRMQDGVCTAPVKRYCQRVKGSFYFRQLAREVAQVRDGARGPVGTRARLQNRKRPGYSPAALDQPANTRGAPDTVPHRCHLGSPDERMAAPGGDSPGAAEARRRFRRGAATVGADKNETHYDECCAKAE